MTKAEAIQSFLEKCGCAVYAATSVPRDADLPYMTWEGQFAAFGDGECPITVNYWAQTSSEARADEVPEILSKMIGRGGVLLACDDGAIWIKRGSPFAQRLDTTGDDTIKRRYINLSAEFFTAD